MGAINAHHGLLLAGGSGGGASYTTLNPSDKNANITLSSGNLVASTGTTGSGIARSVATITGKRYFEAVFTTATAGTATIAAGVATSAASLSASLGYSSADGWAFWGTNTGARHNNATAVAQASAQGDVFGFAVDQTLGRLWIRRNGTWLGGGDPATNTSPIWTNLAGTLHAAACPWTGGNAVTMRFDPASFRDAAPSGFSPIT